MTEADLVEQLADKEHASWARWMEYLFAKCLKGRTIVGAPPGSLVIPGDLVLHWKREAQMAYADLPDHLQQLDRDEVAHILPIIHAYAAEQQAQASSKKRPSSARSATRRARTRPPHIDPRPV